MTNDERPAEARGITPSQTVGPFFAYCLTPSAYDVREIFSHDLVTEDAAGERIVVEGRITDATGAPVPDAMIEIWQPDGEGRFAGADPALANAAFKGFGRAETDPDGRFVFRTVKPGRIAAPGGGYHQAPHVAVGIFARGLLNRLLTRVYFEDEPSNDGDPVLALVPAPRRKTLIARRKPASAEAVYHIDIRLQGENETVFFEV